MHWTALDDPKLLQRAWRLAYSLVGDRHDADEILQRSLMIAARKRSGDRVGLWTFVSRIVTGEARNLRRKNARRRASFKHDGSELMDFQVIDSPDPLEETLQREFRDQLWREFQGLPNELRDALSLRVLSGSNVREAAQALGVSDSTLKRRVTAGLSALRERLGVPESSLTKSLAVMPLLFPMPSTEALSGALAGVGSGAVAVGAAGGAGTVKVVVGIVVGCVALFFVGLAALSIFLFAAVETEEPLEDGVEIRQVEAGRNGPIIEHHGNATRDVGESKEKPDEGETASREALNERLAREAAARAQRESQNNIEGRSEPDAAAVSQLRDVANPWLVELRQAYADLPAREPLRQIGDVHPLSMSPNVQASMALHPEASEVAIHQWSTSHIVIHELPSGRVKKRLPVSGTQATLAYSNNGRHFIALLDRSRVQVWQTFDYKDLGSFIGSKAERLQRIQMLDDATSFAIARQPLSNSEGPGVIQERIQRFNVYAVRPGKTLFESPRELTNSALSPDRKTLLVGDTGGARLVSLESGETLIDFNEKLPGGGIQRLGFTPEGTRCYLETAFALQVFALPSGNEVAKLENQLLGGGSSYGQSFPIVFPRGGMTVIVPRMRDDIWRLEEIELSSGDVVRTVFPSGEYAGREIIDMELAKDGTTAALLLRSLGVILLDLSTGNILSGPQADSGSLAHPDRVMHLDWSPSGQSLLSCGQKGHEIVWDPSSLEQKAHWSAGTRFSTQSFFFRPAGSSADLVASASGEGIQVHDLAGTLTAEHQSESRVRHIVSDGQGGAWQLVFDEAWHIRLIDLALGEVRQNLRVDAMGADLLAQSFGVSPDGRRLVMCSNDSRKTKDGFRVYGSCLHVLNLATAKLERSIDIVGTLMDTHRGAHSLTVADAAFTPDSRELVFVGQSMIGIVNVESGELQAVMENMPGFDEFRELELNRRGNLAYVGDNSGVIHVLDVSSFRKLATRDDNDRHVVSYREFWEEARLDSWRAQSAGIHALALSPDEGTLASSGFDRVIKLWEVERK